MEALEVRSCRSRLRAMCRIIAKFSGALPVRSVAVPHPAFVLPEGHLQHPMHGIPDAPMATGCPEQPGGIRVQAGYIVPGFHRRPVSLPGLPPAAPPSPSRCCSAPMLLSPGHSFPESRQDNCSKSSIVQQRRISIRPCPLSMVWQKSCFIFSNPVFKSGSLPTGKQVFHILQQPSLSSLPWFSFTART